MKKDQLNNWYNKRKERKSSLNFDSLVSGIKNGDFSSLASAITILESTNMSDIEVARKMINHLVPCSGNSIRIGITGVPGVGKSTFIEKFGLLALKRGYKLAVLAIDPSSEKSRGSILGDKTRMNQLAAAKNVFIRPSASGETLGGVARKTRESIILCEAAGYDLILVETVGVGQSEIAVHSMVDFFMLLMLSGAGDELQGIKRGIMEMADSLIITKADGENQENAKRASQSYKNAFHLFPANSNGWIPEVFTCSAQENFNISRVLNMIERFVISTKENESFIKKRATQNNYWLKETIKDHLISSFYSDPQILSELHKAEIAIQKGILSPFEAAEKLLGLKNKS